MMSHDGQHLLAPLPETTAKGRVRQSGSSIFIGRQSDMESVSGGGDQP
jgi:hypothetical protein